MKNSQYYNQSFLLVVSAANGSKLKHRLF